MTTIFSSSPSGIPDCVCFQLDVNYRSTPQIVAFTCGVDLGTTPPGVSLGAGLGPGRWALPPGCRPGRRPRGSRFICQQILDARDKDVPLGQMAILYRNHYDSVVLQGDLVARGIPYTVPQRPAILRAGPHQGRAGLPAGSAESSRRGIVAAHPAALARHRPGQGRGRLSTTRASRPIPSPGSRRLTRWPPSRPRVKVSSRRS